MKDWLPSEIICYLVKKNHDIIKNNSISFLFNDILYCSIDINKNILQYSGVNIPIFVLKKDKLVELKTDQFDKRLGMDNINLTTIMFNFPKNDLIYILNDEFKVNRNEIPEKGVYFRANN